MPLKKALDCEGSGSFLFQEILPTRVKTHLTRFHSEAYAALLVGFRPMAYALAFRALKEAIR